MAVTKQKEMRYVPARELRASTNPDGTKTVSGYAAVFNSPSVDLGGWVEYVAPGAFTKSLMSNPDVVCLRDHDNAILLGRTRSRTLTLTTDEIGLKFDCVLPNTSQANDLVALMERGDIDGCSFSFIANMDDWKTTEDGQTVRTLIDVDLFDVSVVSEPAYPDTSVSLRNAPREIRSLIESKSKRDEESEMEEDARPNPDTDCTCDCAECVAGDCDDCTDPDCDCDGCSCTAASFRSRAKMILALASHRSR